MYKSKLSSGKYQYSIEFRDPHTGKRRRVSTVTDKGRTCDAQTALVVLTGKMNAIMQDCAGADTLTFRGLTERYLAYQAHEVKESTYYRNAMQMKSIRHIIGDDILVSALSASYIRQKFTDSGECAGRLNERLVRLRACLRWEYKNDLIRDISWLAKLDNFHEAETHREKIEDKYMESDELKSVLDAMSDKWRLLTEFLALTGLRIGEAIALTVFDVDLAGREIHITKTYDYIRGETTSPKTDTSNRDISIQDQLLTVCKSVVHYMADQRSRYGYAPSTMFFQGADGGYIYYNSYRQYLGDVTERVIGRRLTPHALRHTHVSLLAAEGIGLDAIARRLGHSDSDVTRDIYMHVTKKLKEKDADNLKAVNIF